MCFHLRWRSLFPSRWLVAGRESVFATQYVSYTVLREEKEVQWQCVLSLSLSLSPRSRAGSCRTRERDVMRDSSLHSILLPASLVRVRCPVQYTTDRPTDRPGVEDEESLLYWLRWQAGHLVWHTSHIRRD